MKTFLFASLLGFSTFLACGEEDKETRTEPEGANPGECSDGADNDFDGDYDCNDADCSGSPDCLESDCDDGADNDQDGDFDCDDSDCADAPECATEDDCADGADNDADGLFDCDDPDCAEDAACVDDFEGDEAGECTDGIDNDSDGLIDCDDPNCEGSPDCDESTQMGSSTTNPGLSCIDILEQGHSNGNGNYWIDPIGGKPVQVYCDMSQGWTLVGNFYDSIEDDFPNDISYVSNGWEQDESGTWGDVQSVLLEYGANSSAAVSFEMIQALDVLGYQNMKVCLVSETGSDNNCRSTKEGSLSLASYSTGNVELAQYSGQPLLYTFGRFAGMPGGVYSYNENDFLFKEYCINVAAGLEGEWGWNPTLCDYNSSAWAGVWHADGCGVSFRPYRSADDEIGGGSNCSTGGEHGNNPSTNSYGFRIYLGE